MKEKVVILGAGESGVGATLLAKSRGYDYLLSDAGEIKAPFKLEIELAELNYEEGGHTEAEVLSASTIVKSPGIPDTAPLVRKAAEQGIEIISEIEFAYRHIAPSRKIIAITGTNGKTTTTMLVHHLMKTCDYIVGLGGNIGHSFSRLAIADEHEYYVLEVSSFQLDGIDKFRPDVAILLNITPDHLDRYDQKFSNYVSSKCRIMRNMSKEHALVYFCDNEPIVEELQRRNVEASLFAISLTDPNIGQGGFFDKDHLVFNFETKNQLRIPITDITLIGKHNMVNTMAAVLTMMQIHTPLQAIVKGLKSFVNAPHRLEDVGSVNEVRFINDSKATNTDAVYYALDGIDDPIVLIAGGVDKGNDYRQLDALVTKKVKAMVCLGINNAKLIAHFGEHVKIIETQSMERAVDEAYKLAESSEVVLLSPACASFDLFRNYEDRGNKFREAVALLRHGLDKRKEVAS